MRFFTTKGRFSRKLTFGHR